MTIVGCFCEKFIEAGWLVALILVATFLNPFSDQVFEPDKAALLRALVVLMVAAWVIWTLDSNALASRRTSREAGAVRPIARAVRTLREMPIAGLALLLLLVHVASTITSVSPRVSWWGSYHRAQGTYTFLTYLGLFFVVLAVLRRGDQLHRLITVLLFTSFPVAVYAVLQHYGTSLLQFSGVGAIEVRVISTLGNAIFLAAYLAMVMPLALWRLLESVGARSAMPVRSVLATVLYGVLFVLQLAAIVFTQSRGPILGLLAELFVFVLLVALLRRRRGWALASMLVAVVAVVLVLVLNIPGLPVPARQTGLPTDSLRDLPYLARFSRMIGGAGMGARRLAWETILDAIRAEPMRAVLGYGAETMKSVFTRFMPAELWVLQGGGQYGTFDRAHNAVFDALFARGTVGVIAYLLLYGIIFYQALRWLGFVQTRREAGSLVGLLAGGAVLGLIVPWLWRGDLVFVGIGMPAGMIAGVILHLLGKTVFAPTIESRTDGTHLFLLAALLAAVVGHFVETQTGIGIVATRSYFWLYTALIVLLGTGRISEPEPARRPESQHLGLGRGRSRRGRRGRRRDRSAVLALPAQGLGPVVAMSLIAAVLLGTLSYAFDHGFNVLGARRPAQLLILVTWLFAGFVVLLERGRFGADVSSLSWDALAYGVTSLGWLLPFALYHRANAQVLDRLNASYLVFVAWLLLTVAGVAVALQRGGASVRPVTQSNWVVLYPAIIFLALLVVWKVDVTRIRADIHEKVGKTAMGAGLWDQAVPNLQRAVALQPRQDQYYSYLGGAYVEQARLASDPATKEAWMERARQAFERGRALSPRDSDHLRQLGLMYRVWAGWAKDATTRQQRLQESLRYYQAAVELNPENPDLRLDLAGAYFTLGLNEDAFAQYRHAVDIGSPAHLGRAYAGLGDVYLVRGQLAEAVEAYRQAMQAGRDRKEVLQARVRAVGEHPNDVQVRESLALVYAATDRRSDALKELNAALAMASSEAERIEVEKLMAMMEK